MSTWSCVIHGQPVAKGRPRACVRGGKVRTYTPEKTARWESHASVTLAAAWGRRGVIVDAVRLDVLAVFARPQRLRTKRLRDTFAAHVAKPDGDNILKAAGDACEKAGIVINDSIVSRASVEKRYAADGEQPHVAIALTWAEHAESTR